MHSICACLLPIGLCLVACAKEPETYEDCILQKVGAGQTVAATQAITSACEQKFGVKPDVIEYRMRGETLRKYRNGKFEAELWRGEPPPPKDGSAEQH